MDNSRCLIISFISFFLLFSASTVFSQTIRIYGTVTDLQTDSVLSNANVIVKGTQQYVATDEKGMYELSIPADKKEVTLLFRYVGYVSQEHSVSLKNITSGLSFSVKMQESFKEISGIEIKEYARQTSPIEVLDVSALKNIPDMSGGGIEAILFGEVNSTNELSSQYSVRGGNYDENIIYVNNIEIYRPLLIRTGEQEGLSFVNPDMVESVSFSSGGFSAQYGDKMSSVLDIRYKKPKRLEGAFSVSLLGASGYIGSSTSRFTQIHGIRYKSSAYLLGSLETEGEYNPTFLDYQTYMTFAFTPKWEITFLGNISRNDYRFKPETRSTTFGTMENWKDFTVYFDGQEKDLFQTLFGALTLNFKPKENITLRLMSSSFYTAENETYDIIGEYWLSEMDGSNDVTVNRGSGVGKYHEHARNRLNATVSNISQLGEIGFNHNKLKWGVTYQREIIDDNINEWEMRDSAGYSIPVSPDRLELFYNLNSDYTMTSNRFMGYLQDTYSKPFASGVWEITGGIRANYWDFNQELLVSPRMSVSWLPDWEKEFGFRLATGIYYQAPFYKEIRDTVIDPNGNVEVSLNKNLKAQRSFQIVAGTDYYFKGWNRPFKLTAEIYYKYIDRIISYSVDNVKVIYSGKNDGYGYAAGVDLKLFGEFVQGTDSWISLSLMQTKENIENDDRGLIPRPSEQRYNVSFFFQDYFPGFPKLKFNLKLIWADGLPFGPPRDEKNRTAFRAPNYRRVDVGAIYSLESGVDRIMDKVLFKWMRSLSFNLEFFNLLGINNVNSYYWITDVTNRQYAVPNYLTGRRINFKIQVNF
jgi:outer membrane receptor protein involved in Fe transport